MLSNRILLSLALIMIVTGILQLTQQTHAQSGFPCPADEYEDNDDFSEPLPVLVANPLRPQNLTRCAGDDDVFRIFVPEGFSLDVQLSFSHAEGNLDLVVYDADVSSVGDSSTITNNERVITPPASQDALYYIYIFSPDANAEVTYTLTLHLFCDGCVIFQGQLLDEGQPVNGSVKVHVEFTKSYSGTNIIHSTDPSGTALDVEVIDGLFTVPINLDGIDRLGYARQYYAQFTINGRTLRPPIPIEPVPQAYGIAAGSTVDINGLGTNLDHLLELRSSAPSTVSGLFINDVAGNAILIRNVVRNGIDIDVERYGVVSRTSSTSVPAGFFDNTSSNSEAVGLYSSGGGDEAADIVLGGIGSDGGATDDGILSSEPSVPNSDLVLRSYDSVFVDLDEDATNTNAVFRVRNDVNATIFEVSENGSRSSGNVIISAETTQSAPVEMYAVASPENWFEDFGSSSLIDGHATVMIDLLFAETVNMTESYHVYLTPLGDCPLFVAEKSATSFTVQAMGGADCTIQFDYRLTAKRAGYTTQRMETVTEAGGEE